MNPIAVRPSPARPVHGVNIATGADTPSYARRAPAAQPWGQFQYGRRYETTFGASKYNAEFDWIRSQLLKHGFDDGDITEIINAREGDALPTLRTLRESSKALAPRYKPSQLTMEAKRRGANGLKELAKFAGPRTAEKVALESIRWQLLKHGFDDSDIDEIISARPKHALRTLRKLRDCSNALAPLYTPSQLVIEVKCRGAEGLKALLRFAGPEAEEKVELESTRRGLFADGFDDRDVGEIVSALGGDALQTLRRLRSRSKELAPFYTPSQLVMAVKRSGADGLEELIKSAEREMVAQLEPESIRSELVALGFDADGLEELERKLGGHALLTLEALRDTNDELASLYPNKSQVLEVAIHKGAGGVRALIKSRSLILGWGYSPDAVVEVMLRDGVDGIIRLRKQGRPS